MDNIYGENWGHLQKPHEQYIDNVYLSAMNALQNRHFASQNGQQGPSQFPARHVHQSMQNFEGPLFFGEVPSNVNGDHLQSVVQDSAAENSTNEVAIKETTTAHEKAARKMIKPRKARTVFTYHQVSQMENSFKVNKYMPRSECETLSETLGLRKEEIRVWFQNRRAKLKKKIAQENLNQSTSNGQWQSESYFKNGHMTMGFRVNPDSVQTTQVTSTSGPHEPNHCSKNVDEMSVFAHQVVGQQYDFQCMYGAQQFLQTSEHLAPNHAECPSVIDHMNQQGDVQNYCDLGQNWGNAGHFSQYVPSQEISNYSRSKVENKLFQKGSCAMNHGGLLTIKSENSDDCYNEFGIKNNACNVL